MARRRRNAGDPPPPKKFEFKFQLFYPEFRKAMQKTAVAAKGIKNNINTTYAKLTGQPGAKILPRPKRRGSRRGGRRNRR